MDDKVRFLLEILFDDSNDRFMRKTARDTLLGMGVTDAEIGTFRHRRKFKNELDNIHDEMEREVEKVYGYPSAGKDHKSFLKLAIMTMLFFFLILIGVIFWGIARNTTTTETSTYEQTVESTEGNEL